MKGLDCPTSLIDYGADLKADGISFVMRYLFSYSSYKQIVTSAEIDHLHSFGIGVGFIWENGYPTTNDYFTLNHGSDDGASCKTILGGLKLNIPSYVPIWATADGDVSGNLVNDYLLQFKRSFSNGFVNPVGIYGSGEIIQTCVKMGTTSLGWLANSRGWRGYEIDEGQINQGVKTDYHGVATDLDFANENVLKSVVWMPD